MRFGTIVGLFLLNLISIIVVANTFTADNLISWPRPSEIILSPDNKLGIYFTTSYDITTKKESVQAFILKFSESGANVTSSTYNVTKLFSNLKGGLKKSPDITWLDKDSLAFIFENQIWSLDVPANLGNIEGEPNLILSPSSIPPLHNVEKISDLKYKVDSQTVVFKALEKGQSHLQNFGGTGSVFDQLPVRQWDFFIDPLEKTQLVYAKISKSFNRNSYWVISEGPHNLLRNFEKELPAGLFGFNTEFCLSPDGKEVAFISTVPKKDQTWATKTDVFIVATGQYNKPKSLTPDNMGSSQQPKYSPNGKYLAWLQTKVPHHYGDKNHIVLYDRLTGKTKELVSLWDRSPSYIEWSGNSNKILMTAEQFGRKLLFSVSISSEHIEQITKHGSTEKIKFVRDNTFVASFKEMSSPPEFVTIKLFDEFQVTRQTNINYERAKGYSLSKLEKFWFKGSDDHDIHGFLLRPPNFNQLQKYPLAFFIHGGPHDAWLDDWNNLWNFNVYANAGYFVVAINPHGSSGYGQNFTDSIRKDWGGKPYNDLMLGLDYILEKNKNIDIKRMCALGPSYGGYMANWINGHSNRFSCLVSHSGAFDLKSTYYTSDKPYLIEQNFGRTPYEDPNLYENFSPSSYVSNWSTPTMIIHSAKDYRFSEGEGLAAFTALQRRGIHSRLLYFYDEFHWVEKPANSLFWHYEVLKWINHYCYPDIVNKGKGSENTIYNISVKPYNSSSMVSLPPTCPSTH